MNHRHRLAPLILAAAITLSACTLIPFENPEEQKRKLLEQGTEAEIIMPKAQDALVGDTVVFDELRTLEGGLLASYEGRMPKFSTDGPHGQVFKQMNEHYEKIITGCREDCKAFLQTVKTIYGSEWQNMVEIPGAYTTRHSYQLLPTQEKYICILATYTYTTPKGASYTSYYPDVFLAENGWRLSFDGIFGHNAAEAKALLMEQIKLWCQKSNIEHEKLESLAVEAFTEYYAMNETDLIFYTEPFQLSTNDGNGYIIELSMSLFEGLLID